MGPGLLRTFPPGCTAPQSRLQTMYVGPRAAPPPDIPAAHPPPSCHSAGRIFILRGGAHRSTGRLAGGGSTFLCRVPRFLVGRHPTRCQGDTPWSPGVEPTPPGRSSSQVLNNNRGFGDVSVNYRLIG
ncbi:hypothetical protein EYF80_059347 [Liparis tanakae]|uniref:Uncharacterized protein n=1 Tax=Liparis tanakae TaxID=230148 RepID=A0A4Z2EPG8_9TELE|nr:hypothetical protein EYF80_059347 [Liparis tanakae]